MCVSCEHYSLLISRFVVAICISYICNLEHFLLCNFAFGLFGLRALHVTHTHTSCYRYKEVGRTGAGNGWSGFFLGFWPAVFSFLIYALLKAGVSLAVEVIILGGLCMLIAMINAPLNGILPSAVEIAFYGSIEEEVDKALSIVVSMSFHQQ